MPAGNVIRLVIADCGQILYPPGLSCSSFTPSLSLPAMNCMRARLCIASCASAPFVRSGGPVVCESLLEETRRYRRFIETSQRVDRGSICTTIASGQQRRGVLGERARRLPSKSRIMEFCQYSRYFRLSKSQLQFSIRVSVIEFIILKYILPCHHSYPPLFVGCQQMYIPNLQIFDDISVIGILFHFCSKSKLNLIINSTAHCSFHLHLTESVCISMSWSWPVAECGIKLRHNTYPSSIPTRGINFV